MRWKEFVQLDKFWKKLKTYIKKKLSPINCPNLDQEDVKLRFRLLKLLNDCIKPNLLQKLNHSQERIKFLVQRKQVLRWFESFFFFFVIFIQPFFSFLCSLGDPPSLASYPITPSKEVLSPAFLKGVCSSFNLGFKIKLETKIKYHFLNLCT